MSRLLTLANLCALPFVIPHEFSHWLVARLGTDDAQMAVEVSGGRAAAGWPPLESRPLRVFAFLAPTAFGSILIGLWLVSDHGIDGWRLIMAIGLAGYTTPSPADLRGALGLQDVQQQTANS